MTRRSPIRHKVKSHTREGKHINSFNRGKGTRPNRQTKINRFVGRPPYPYKKPRKIEPMLAEAGEIEDVKTHSLWAQRKYDGTRCVIIKSGNKVVMRGRSWKNDYADRFPEIVAEIRKLPIENCVLDSELTFFEKGTDRDVFLTALAKPETKKEFIAKVMVFDALFVENENVERETFEDRMKIIDNLIPKRLRHVDITKTVKTKKREFFDDITEKKQGEGIMLKERMSPYREGKRTKEWLKIKGWKDDDAIVVGYTQGLGRRGETFGSLILAQVDKTGKLRYVGKTSGFSDTELGALKRRLDKLAHRGKPIPNFPDAKVWVPPEIVVEVKYYEKTKNGIFRFPDFTRERTDKLPKECIFRKPK